MFKLKIDKKYLSLINLFKHQKKKALIGGLLMILNILLILPTPFLTMYLIDDVLPEKNTTLLVLISLSAIFVIIIKSVFEAVQTIFFQGFNEYIVFKIQVKLFEKIQEIPYLLRKKLQTGYLMSRAKDDPEKIHALFVETILSFFKDSLTLIVGIIIIFYIHWKLALVSIMLLPIYVKIVMYYSTRLRKASAKYYEKKAQVSKTMQESFGLFELFRVFNAKKYDTIRTIKSLKASIRSNIRTVVLASWSSAFMSIIGGLGPVIVIWYGLYEIMQGNLLLGELIAFNSFLGYLFGPTNRLMKINLSIQKSLAAWDRIYEYIAEPHKNERKRVVFNDFEIKGRIQLCDVCFNYNDETVLNNISINIPEKSTITIVGESGCGKTTLISLLTKLNIANTGRILIDGKNICDYEEGMYRNQIAIVSQEPALFHNTILNNIKLGNFKVSKTDIINACKIVEMHEYIESLPDKYDTLIDEKSGNFSIGQKQRLAIARAIVRNPKILIMDEPTSNLDIKTESKIFASLKRFIKERTTIIITHRELLNIDLDIVYHLKNGEIQILNKGRLNACSEQIETTN